MHTPKVPMNKLSRILAQEYSDEFDKKRKNAILVSYHKYGPAKDNFGKGLVDAVGCIELNLKKFKETGNTEYLVDIANYAMFRYMYPQGNESYRPTDSNQSAGVDGITINEIKEIKNESSYN